VPPLVHVSFVVQALPSLHVPPVLTGFEHAPALHAPGKWH